MSQRLKNIVRGCLIASIVLAIGLVTQVYAEEKPWWPFPVVELSSGEAKVVDYVPLEKVTKKWNVVALFPQLLDKSWIGANYGLVKEAERLGVKLTILDAGGYDNLNRQLSQYDDAVAMRADAIITSVISEAGMSKKFNEGMAKGIVNVAMINPVYEAKIDGAVYNDVKFFGRAAADVVMEEFKESPKVRVALSLARRARVGPRKSTRHFVSV